MSWQVSYIPQAVDDLKKLDGSNRKQVLKALDKVSQNPLPTNEGGYGKALGNKLGNNLAGLLKIKLRQAGIRIVYDLVRDAHSMRIIVVGIRADNQVYDIAAKRILEI